ncbi:hypothetical protein ACSIGC_04995 [Tenacibaculum sp. ZS6-P6]|uniref:hypothetical protein n=1 Tax=Tenacibaculum sp. ZS6-P6 TaxID=3447503 RepID=UPI003F9C896A
MKDRLFFGNTLSAVEYSFDQEGNEVFLYLQLERKKLELEVKESKKFVEKNELFDFINKTSQEHVVLVINNKHVLSKSIDIKNDNDAVVFKRAFSSLNINDFYQESLPLNEGTFLSVVRENYVKSLIKEFTSKKITVLDVLLGTTSISSLLSIISYENIFTSNTELLIDSGKMVSINSKRFVDCDYEINGLRISNQHVLSLSAIVNCYLNKTVNYKSDQYKEYIEKKKFNLGYKLVLGILFLLVLMNFIYFNSYSSEVNKFTEQLELKKNDKRKLLNLKEKVKKKRKLLSELQSSTSFSIAKYPDQIVYGIPKSVVLKVLSYQSLNKVLKKDKETNFNLKEIEVKGTFNNYIEFTSWIDNLERKAWVKELLELTTEKDKRKNNSNFHILILIE